MATSYLRAFFLMFVLGLSTAARANGQVENAMQLWLGDLRSAYNLTVDQVGQFKINEAKASSAKLTELSQKMVEAAKEIQEDSNALAPSLGAAWSDTQRQLEAFHQAGIALGAQLGKQKPDAGPLKSALSSADSAVMKSWEFTKAFGKQYGAFMGGTVENSKQLFDGAVSDGYDSTVQYLDAYDTDRGKLEVDRFKELIGRLAELTYLANSQAGAFSSPLGSVWKTADDETKQLQIETGVIQSQVGSTDFNLSGMKAKYGNLNAAIVIAYKETLSFGERLRAISDNWG